MNRAALVAIIVGLLAIGMGLLHSFLLMRLPWRGRRWWYNPEFADPRMRRSHLAFNVGTVLLGLSSLMNGLQLGFHLLSPNLEIVLVVLPTLALACLLTAIVFRLQARRG